MTERLGRLRTTLRPLEDQQEPLVFPQQSNNEHLGQALGHLDVLSTRPPRLLMKVMMSSLVARTRKRSLSPLRKSQFLAVSLAVPSPSRPQTVDALILSTSASLPRYSLSSSLHVTSLQYLSQPVVDDVVDNGQANFGLVLADWDISWPCCLEKSPPLQPS